MSAVVLMVALWLPAEVILFTSRMPFCTSVGISARMAGRCVLRIAQLVQPPLLVLELFMFLVSP